MTRKLLLAIALIASGCRGGTSTEPPIIPIRNMHEVPRYDPQEESPYFADGRAMRPPVEGTIPQEMDVDEALETGLNPDGSYVLTIPATAIAEAPIQCNEAADCPVGRACNGRHTCDPETPQQSMERVLARGQERFGIYCVPCHGALGDGQGMVGRISRVATIQPPTYHDDRLRHVPDGQIYATIRNGVRNMPAYRAQIPVRDRWAIVAYVRALQLSQMDQRTAMREPAGQEERR